MTNALRIKGYLDGQMKGFSGTEGYVRNQFLHVKEQRRMMDCLLSSPEAQNLGVTTWSTDRTLS